VAGAVTTVRWDRFPLVQQEPRARAWLAIEADLGLARNTVEAYGRAAEDFLGFLARSDVALIGASRADIAAYVRELSSRRPGRNGQAAAGGSDRLANATLQQRITAVRLLYNYLVEEGLRWDNPVGRRRYTPTRGFGGARERSLIPRYRRLPWIPSDEEWQAILAAARSQPLRNRLMLALAYDAALRREELCSVEVADIDPSRRLVRVRVETTKSRRERVIPYSEPTGLLLAAYLPARRGLSRERGRLFRSESDRNRGAPVSIWTWSKVVREIAVRAGVPRFTTHSMRHLRLTDLARLGWEVHALATFAGHRSIQSTLQYVHLSGRELSDRLGQSMAALHLERQRQLEDLLR
jgi:integrase/recombinase XerD